jgi:hypothetical protein
MDDFTHDDDRSQASFGLIVGRRYMAMTQESEHLFLFRPSQTFAESLGPLVAERLSAQATELAAQSTLLFFGGLGAPAAFS